MKTRLVTIALVALTALMMLALPASAHVNDRSINDRVTDTRETRQGGTPFAGFLGPVESFVGSEAYVTAHSGMECGALSSPNMTALGPAGIGFDLRFVCPADK